MTQFLVCEGVLVKSKISEGERLSINAFKCILVLSKGIDRRKRSEFVLENTIMEFVAHYIFNLRKLDINPSLSW